MCAKGFERGKGEVGKRAKSALKCKAFEKPNFAALFTDGGGG
jgi:hypothetical protein